MDLSVADNIKDTITIAKLWEMQYKLISITLKCLVVQSCKQQDSKTLSREHIETKCYSLSSSAYLLLKSAQPLSREGLHWMSLIDGEQGEGLLCISLLWIALLKVIHLVTALGDFS